jgi:hypothetical protein
VPSYCVDLRVPYMMSKVDLDELRAAQALPSADQIRTRFARRAGMRYSRAAVPEQAVVEISEPLEKLLRLRPRANEILADYGLDPGPTPDQRFGSSSLRREEDVPEADDLWHEVASELRDRSSLLDLNDDDRNAVIAYDDRRVASMRRSSVWLRDEPTPSNATSPSNGVLGRSSPNGKRFSGMLGYLQAPSELASETARAKPHRLL